MTVTVASTRPIDPLRPGAPGHYADELVEVRRGGPVPASATRTASFATWAQDCRVHLTHDLPVDRIDNDLSGLLADELFATGWLSGSDLFERLFTGIVLTSAADPVAAWELFYRNTLARLEGPRSAKNGSSRGQIRSGAMGGPEGSLAGYAPVYAHAAELAGTGEVLELGSCFGFLSLQLARQARVTASDVTANTVRLLARVAPHLGRPLETMVCDAARVPRESGSFDTVLAVHLLEHLEPAHGDAVLAEMLRLARHRVVVAVPFETEPTAAFGHVRVFTLDDLAALGERSGWSATHYEHHGGWLVLDRP